MSELSGYRLAKSDAPIEVLLRSDEWRPLVKFAEGWFRQPISEDTGVAASEMDALAERFGAPIPAALREWYRMLGAHESTLFDTNQDYPMPLERVAESPRWLALFEENQGGWLCGILREDCHLPDPPVHFEARGFDLVTDAGLDPKSLVDGRFTRIASRFTEFILGMTLRQLASGQGSPEIMVPGVGAAEFAGGEEGPERIRKRFSLRPALDDFPAGFMPEFDGSDLVMIPELRVIARTPEVFDEVFQVAGTSGQSLSPEWFAR